MGIFRFLKWYSEVKGYCLLHIVMVHHVNQKKLIDMEEFISHRSPPKFKIFNSWRRNWCQMCSGRHNVYCKWTSCYMVKQFMQSDTVKNSETLFIERDKDTCVRMSFCHSTHCQPDKSTAPAALDGLLRLFI